MRIRKYALCVIKQLQNRRNHKNESDKNNFMSSLAEQNYKEFQVEIDDYQIDRFRKLGATERRGFLSSPLLSFWVSGSEYGDVKVGDKIHVDNNSFAVKSVILFKDHDLFLANAGQYLLADQLPLARSWVLRRTAGAGNSEAVTIIRAVPNNRTVFRSIMRWTWRVLLAIVFLFMLLLVYSFFSL